MSAFKHIDEWLDEPATNAGESDAKQWLAEFRKPASCKNTIWLHEHRLTCEYSGRKCRCTGASRLGDVWLVTNMKQEVGYDFRVNVLDCQDWKLVEINNLKS